MSLRGYLSATQKRHGTPIVLTYTVVADAQADDHFSNWGVGTTNDPTPPSQMSGFAHSEYNVTQHALLDQAQALQLYRQLFSMDGSTIIRYSDRLTYEGATKTLDSNYAAGKYLWAFMTNADPSVSGTAPIALAGPYKIK